MSAADFDPRGGAASQRVVLVTGASRGIGRAAALAFARAGAHVVALARTQGALEELDDEIKAARPGEESATLVPMDLRDSDTIDRLGEALYRRWGRLDAFVGNAGTLGVLSPLHHVEPKEWDVVIATNVTANWRLIRSLDPLLRQSAAGRVAFVTSAAGYREDTRAYWGALRSLEGGGRHARPHLRGGDDEHVEHPRHAGQPRPPAHPDARQGHAGEDPMTLRTPRSLRRRSSKSARRSGRRPGNCTISRPTKILSFQGPA